MDYLTPNTLGLFILGIGLLQAFMMGFQVGRGIEKGSNVDKTENKQKETNDPYRHTINCCYNLADCSAMRVKELIARLAVEDPEMRVVVDGYEQGFDEPDNVRYVNMIPNPTKKDWEGEFEEVLLNSDIKEAELALLLPRKS